MRVRTFSAVVPIAICLTFLAPEARAQDGACTIDLAPPAFAAPAEDSLHALPHDARSAHTATHGQLLFGNERVFLSHLAVFMGSPQAHPHHFQVILEVSIDDDDARALYLKSTEETPETIHTAVPPPFDQAALVADYPGRSPLDALPGTTIVRGHFEQGGDAVARSAMTIERIVHFREFAPGGALMETPSYILFGGGADVYAAHVLSGPPDFDQMLSVSVSTGDDVADDDRSALMDAIGGGAWITLEGRANEEGSRLAAGEVLDCSVSRADGTSFTAQVEIGREIYCEAGEFDTLVVQSFNRPRRCEG